MDEAILRTIEVNKHKTLLLVGAGTTNYGRCEVCFEDSYEDVVEYFGESDLSRAFRAAKDMDVPYIFLLNVRAEQDYFDILEMLSENDFAYIVFVSRHLSSLYNDEYDSQLVHNYFSYLLGRLGPDHNSTIIVSDKHASLYEDIDSYLAGMQEIMNRFLVRCSSRANLENIIFVANNLQNTVYASVVLAGALINSSPKDYPSGHFGTALFDIDYFDHPGDMVFFKGHANAPTTIENLVNFLPAGTPQKIVPVSKALKHIKREMDFKEFLGRLYSSHMKLLFNKRLSEYLDSVKGVIIYDYEILSIEAYRSSAAAVTMLSRFTVTPFNCLEKCQLTKEIYLE